MVKNHKLLIKKISESLVRRNPDFPDQKYIQKEILQKVAEVQANYSSDEIEKIVAKKAKGNGACGQELRFYCCSKTT